MNACSFFRPRSTTWRWTWQPLGSGAMCVSVKCFWSTGHRWCPCLLLPTTVKSLSRYFSSLLGCSFEFASGSSLITLIFIVRRDRFTRKQLLSHQVIQWKVYQSLWQRRRAQSLRRMSWNPEVPLFKRLLTEIVVCFSISGDFTSLPIDDRLKIYKFLLLYWLQAWLGWKTLETRATWTQLFKHFPTGDDTVCCDTQQTTVM